MLSLDLVLSILVLAALALIGGAIVLWQRGQRQQALLMAVLAGVMAVNVGIWVLPDEAGNVPIGQELR
jgi:drug/metabolite transporter superfamily protein YnfA